MRLDYQVNNRPSTTKSQVDPATLRPHKKPCGLAAAGFKELGAIYPAPGCSYLIVVGFAWNYMFQHGFIDMNVPPVFS